MEEDKEAGSKKKFRQDDPPATAVSIFTEDLIIEILSRLPARPVCRYKCVSVPWRDLIADPVHRKKLPQTLAGFLYMTRNSGGDWGHWSRHFASVSGGTYPVDPSLHFLQPNKHKYIILEDTCNGLLLCARYNKETPATDMDKFHYVVCNPATERWIEFPPPPQALANKFRSATRLAFDLAVSSHFHVLQFGETIQGDGIHVIGVDIFSSQTGAWIHRDSGGLVEKTALYRGYRSVFLGGMLRPVGNLISMTIDQEALVMVDMEGKAWKTIPLPDGSRKQISRHHTSGFRSGIVVPFPRPSVLADTAGFGKLCQGSGHLLAANWSLDS